MKKRISEYALYRWRYQLGYTLALLVAGMIVVFAGLYVPDGTRAAERATAVASGQLSFVDFNPESVIGLPFNLLQRASFEIFGISTMTIKLPSLILGVLSILGIFLLIKQWFTRNVALITAFIALTMPLMLFTAQDATLTSFSIFTSIWLLLAATHVTRRHKPYLIWKIATFMLLALNLYAPLGLYLDLAILSTILFHPHIRQVARKLSINKLMIGIVISLLILTPLVYSLVMQPKIGLELLGYVGVPDYKANGLMLAKSLFDFRSIGAEPIIRPILSLGILSLVIIGIYRFIRIKYTARSYIVALWAILLIPAIYLNPENVGLLLVLIIIMVATGMSTLIAEWYKMFPRNPYARLAGLLPLSLIVFGLVFSGFNRYSASYYHEPSVVALYNSDTRLVNEAAVKAKQITEKPLTLIVNQDDLQYYQLISKYNKQFEVTASIETPPPVIIAGNQEQRSTISSAPDLIITSRINQSADRFYLYTSTENSRILD